MVKSGNFELILLAAAALIVVMSLLFAALAYVGGRKAGNRKAMLRRSAMNREIFGAMNIPYTSHIHENVVKTK